MEEEGGITRRWNMYGEGGGVTEERRGKKYGY